MASWPGKDKYYVTEVCKTPARHFHTHPPPPKIRIWKCYSNFYAVEVLENVLRSKWQLKPAAEEDFLGIKTAYPNAVKWGEAKTSKLSYKPWEMMDLPSRWRNRQWYGIHARADA